MAKKGTNRTVKTRIRCTSCDVVYYNPLAAALELHEEPFTTMRTFKTKEGLIKNVKSALNTDTFCVVDCKNIKKTDAIYECTFEDFMEIAQFVSTVEVKDGGDK